jgi:hypothetical protein
MVLRDVVYGLYTRRLRSQLAGRMVPGHVGLNAPETPSLTVLSGTPRARSARPGHRLEAVSVGAVP